MSDTLTPEHTSWLDGFLGGGNSDPAPQAEPSQPGPASGGLSYSGPDGFGFTIGSGDETPTENAQQQPAPAEAVPAQPSWGPSAFGTDETADGATPDEVFGGTADQAPSAAAPSEASSAVPATPATESGASAAEQAEGTPSFWDRALAASITDPTLGVARVVGGEFNDWMAERDRQEAAEESEKAESRARREAQERLDAQGNTKEKADEEDRRRQAVEDDYWKKQSEKTQEIMREKQAEADAQAQYQKDKASKDPATQEYMTREERKH